MYKKVLFTFLVVIAGKSHAADCYGVPDAVKMGEYRSQESFVIVNLAGRDFRLGYPDDPAVEVRRSLVEKALVNEKTVMLRFWDVATCEQASEERLIPNSVRLIR